MGCQKGKPNHNMHRDSQGRAAVTLMYFGAKSAPCGVIRPCSLVMLNVLCNRMKRLIIIILLIIVIPFSAFAKAVVYSFEEKIQESELIIVCELNRVEHKLFSKNMAHVIVVETLKGDHKVKNVKVAYGNKLFNNERYRKLFQKDRKYILFLNCREDQYRMTGHLSGHYELLKDGQVCFGGEKTPFDIFVKKISTILNQDSSTEPLASPDTKGLAAPGVR